MNKFKQQLCNVAAFSIMSGCAYADSDLSKPQTMEEIWKIFQAQQKQINQMSNHFYALLLLAQSGIFTLFMEDNGYYVNKLSLVGCCILALSSYSNLTSATENWKLQKQLQFPQWLSVKIDHRTRYEGYDNTFTKNTDGGDQILAFRTNVFIGITYNQFRVGAEFIDSRIALEGSNTPVNTTLVNQTDLVQAYLTWQTDNLLDSGLGFSINAGRQTMNVGSRRLVARNRFRNTLNNFTGIDTIIRNTNHWHWRNFVVLPVSRLPSDQVSLRAGRAKFDQESFSRVFAGSF